MIYDVYEYPELSRKFRVLSVPKTYVNDKTYFDGGAPNSNMMAWTLAMMIQQALDDSIPSGRFQFRGIDNSKLRTED